MCGSRSDIRNGKGVPGDRHCVTAEPMGALGLGSESEVGLVFLQLHHEVMDVDEFGPGREGAELRLGQHPVEAVVELDQLCQRPLCRAEGQTHGAGLSESTRVSGQRKSRETQHGTQVKGGLGVAGHLDDAGSVSKVGKTPHDILTQGLH